MYENHEGDISYDAETLDAIRRTGVPPRFENATLHPSVTGTIADEARKFVLAWPQRPSMILAGPTGMGKTHFACAAMNEIVHHWGRREEVEAFFFNINTTLHEVLDTRQFRRYDTYTSLVRKITTADILIVDDLLHVPRHEFAKDVLYRIYEARYAAKLPTITTLNGDFVPRAPDWSAVLDTFNEPFMRRLVEAAQDYTIAL